MISYIKDKDDPQVKLRARAHTHTWVDQHTSDMMTHHFIDILSI